MPIELEDSKVSKKTVDILGNKWQVSHGFNLYIDISSACNASCPFCIAPTIGRKDGVGFSDGTKFALDLTETVNGTVQIVGGEPMISKRLPSLLQEIEKHDYRRVALNTNGSFISDEKIDLMRLAKVNNVNISRHHYDEHLNQEVMRLRPELSNTDLISGARRVIDSGIDLRMQCNLIKGHIDSVPKMLDYLGWCTNIGCREISFSQLFPLGLFDYQKPIERGYTERMQVNLRQLVSDIDSSSIFSPTAADDLRVDGMSVWGSSNWGNGAKRRFWYGPNETLISLKTLSGYDKNGLPSLTHYNKEDDWELQEGNLAFAVLHTDGKVTASWDKKERLLFSP